MCFSHPDEVGRHVVIHAGRYLLGRQFSTELGDKSLASYAKTEIRISADESSDIHFSSPRELAA
jgi:hypothetical protein